MDGERIFASLGRSLRPLLVLVTILYVGGTSRAQSILPQGWEAMPDNDKAKIVLRNFADEAFRDQGSRVPIQGMPALYHDMQRLVLSMKPNSANLTGRWIQCGRMEEYYAASVASRSDIASPSHYLEFFGAGYSGDFTLHDAANFGFEGTGQYSWTQPGVIGLRFSSDSRNLTVRAALGYLFAIDSSTICILWKEKSRQIPSITTMTEAKPARVNRVRNPNLIKLDVKPGESVADAEQRAMVTVLGLTKGQADQIVAAKKKHAEDFDKMTVRDDFRKGDRTTQIAMIKQCSKSLFLSMRKILTPKQWETYCLRFGVSKNAGLD